MKTFFALGVVLLSCTAASAKVSPLDPPRLTHPPEETAVLTGPAGALLEANYFHAPQTSDASGRIFPCRLKLEYFDKTSLTYACR